MRADSDAERHLAAVSARAAYVPVDGEPGIVIVSAGATYADAKHEEFPAQQHESRRWRAWHAAERFALETEAHRYVLAHAQEWNLSLREIEENERLLEFWESQLP